jgi:uncharacterized protein (TIGR02246 family)
MRKRLMNSARFSMALLVAVALLHGWAVRGRSAAAGQPDTAERAAIAAVLERQQAAWNRADVSAFLKGYWESPDLTFSGTAGITRGFAGVEARYRKNYPDQAAMGQLQFSGLEFRFLGPKAALVLGHWHLTREKGDIGGVFTLVWQKFPDGWKIVHDHTSEVGEAK